MDLRVTKTLSAILGAFDEVFSRTPYEKITVSEVCGLAQVRTNTFYRHFGGKDDLLRYYLANIRSQFLEDSATSCHDDALGYAEHMCAETMRFLKTGEGMRRLYRSQSLPASNLDLVTAFMAEGLTELLEAYEAERDVKLPGGARNVSLFYVAGLLRAERAWVRGDGDLSEEELVASTTEYLRRILLDS